MPPIEPRLSRATLALRRRVAASLEEGRFRGPVSAALAAVWEPMAARSLVRPARLPEQNGVAIPVVAIGGATLGGSGKTRLASACAGALAEDGVRVVLVGHGYRGRGGARIVSAEDRLADVGDEALACARRLGASVPVVIGPTRQHALDHAASLRPDVLVVDGPLALGRSGESRAGVLSLLAVDADRPWGGGALPPRGDLRASRAALLALADHVVALPSTVSEVTIGETTRALDHSLGQVGLFVALARPTRIVRAVRAAGLTLDEVVTVPDHGPLGASDRRRLETSGHLLWLATEKCATHLDPSRLRVGVIRDAFVLPAPLLAVLHCFVTTKRPLGGRT